MIAVCPPGCPCVGCAFRAARIARRGRQSTSLAASHVPEPPQPSAPPAAPVRRVVWLSNEEIVELVRSEVPLDETPLWQRALAARASCRVTRRR